MENIHGRKRVRRSRAEIEELLAAFERSGETQQAFCRRNGLSVATLSNWRRKAASTGGSAEILRPVRLAGAGAPQGVVVRLANGTEVFFPAGSAPGEIAAVVSSLNPGGLC